MSHLAGEYSDRGEYHRYLDPNWSYYPIFIRKMAIVEKYLMSINSNVKILDAGCGEGLLVEKFRGLKKDIIGIDINIESEFVQKGDVLNLPYNSDSFDVVLFLDVIEHLNVSEQIESLKQIHRVLKQHGKLVISIPNLAHKASRWRFYKYGELLRTANIYKHPGDRPIKEYIHLFSEVGFKIQHRIPIKLTLPPLKERLMRVFLGKKGFEKYIYSEKRNPDDCFLNVFLLVKK